MNTYKTQPTLKKKARKMSVLAAGIIAAASMFLPMQRANACTGAEQIGMAGAGGEVLADNAHAVYWNAGGLLANLKQPEATYCHTFKNDGGNLMIRYDNVFSLATPIGKKGVWGTGAMYIDSCRDAYQSADKEIWNILKIAAGARVYDNKQTKAFIGAGIELSKIKDIKASTATNYISADLGAVAIRQSAIFEGDELRIGVLGQSIINVRPSISETIKNFGGKGKLTGALTDYDIFNIKNLREIRLGIRQSLETKIGKISLEAGTGNRDMMESSALGVAWESPKKGSKISCAYMKTKDEKTQIEGKGILLEFTKGF